MKNKVKVILILVEMYIRFKPIRLLRAIILYLVQIRTFKIVKNNEFKKFKYYPCFEDNLSFTPVEPTYFFQDSWAASKIFKLKPSHHVDIGSSAITIGIISQFCPTTMVDIRPIDLKLPGLDFKKGSILELPFEDASIESLSSLCVIEHIGLGRYGDPIDQFGSEKAIKEIERVMITGGSVIISLPVDKENTIYFNAHRAFTREFIIKLFKNFELVDELYHYGRQTHNFYDESRGFGTGLYMFKKV